MEDNVALDSSKQKKFVKSIKGIKKLIQKNEQKAAVEKSLVNLKSKEDVVQEGKKIKKRKFPRGLVYLSHIPHGFYEHQMTQYFKQFGVVTNARVIRSKRTGRSKGFAFVEFKEPSVAEIVAETMNNYLMGKRLIKAAYIPPEKQRRKAMRKHWNDINNPANNLRMEMKKKFNANKDEQGELKRARKLLSNLNKTKKKLKEIGINYDFFMPVDIPEAILETTIKIEKVEENSQDDKDQKEKKKKKKKKIKAENSKEETKKLNSEVVKESKLRNIETNKKENSKVNDMNYKKVEEKQKKGKNKEQKSKLALDGNKKQQKNKESKLNDSGIKPMGDFVKVGHYSDDGDSSLEFDSDEYEKMMGSDDEFDSDDHSDDSEGEEDVDDESQKEEESFAILPPAKNNLQQNKKQNKEMKRKATQNQVCLLKKPKFEKQKSQKQMKKPIKVKK